MFSLELNPALEARLQDGLENSIIAKTVYVVSGIMGGFGVLCTIGTLLNEGLLKAAIVFAFFIISSLIGTAVSLVMAYFSIGKTT